MRKPIAKRRSQRGFTLIETMIAVALMTIGILTLVATFGEAVGATQYAEQNMIARQKALQALESVYTARNTQQLTFSQIANTTSGGIFVQSETMLCAGPDGLVNTTDDINCPASGPCVAGPECIVLPGPDGILGTPDDVAFSLANMTRQVTIANALNADGSINQTLKTVTVTITYITNGAAAAGTAAIRTYTINALVASS